MLIRILIYLLLFFADLLHNTCLNKTIYFFTNESEKTMAIVLYVVVVFFLGKTEEISGAEKNIQMGLIWWERICVRLNKLGPFFWLAEKMDFKVDAWATLWATVLQYRFVLWCLNESKWISTCPARLLFQIWNGEHQLLHQRLSMCTEECTKSRTTKILNRLLQSH